ncbi:hypothetical protein ACROYT_G030238, partial [Oculina patagonica]
NRGKPVRHYSDVQSEPATVLKSGFTHELVRDVICASSLRASSVPRENILRINRVIKDISSTNSSSSLPGGETQESRNEETLQFSGIVSYNENLKPFDVGLKGNVCMQILQYLNSFDEVLALYDYNEAAVFLSNRSTDRRSLEERRGTAIHGLHTFEYMV